MPHDFLHLFLYLISSLYAEFFSFSIQVKILCILKPSKLLTCGTGIPEDMIKKAISLGVAKINVNTECQLSFAAATREYIEAGKDQQGKGFDPRKLLAPGADAIKATVKEKMELFGSVGKA